MNPVGGRNKSICGDRASASMNTISTAACKITLINTEGQPQFQKLLPIFMQGTSASMFTIKLSERLSDHLLIEYYDDNGNLVAHLIAQPTQDSITTRV